MKTSREICFLDYLAGTLSTAYKGVITSLLLKDFCMNEENDSVSVAGTVLALPPGEYRASLIESGVELARNPIERGSFELRADAERMRRAQQLQVDIIQNGRHIGTFLLKKEGGQEIYVSAARLSEELKDVDLKLLTLPFRNKIGLLQKAEEIVTQIASPKKDWAAFSEKLHVFAEDFFWSDRAAFYKAFGLLVRFSLEAAEQSGGRAAVREFGNFLDCVRLPLFRDSDDEAVRGAAEVWLDQIKASRADLSGQVYKTTDTLAVMHARFRDADISPGLHALIGSVRKRLEAMPALNAAVLDLLQNRIPADEYRTLRGYAQTTRNRLLAGLDGAGQSLENGRTADALAFLRGMDPELIDTSAMIAKFFGTITNNITADSAGVFSDAVKQAISLFPALSAAALESVKSNLPLILEKLILLGRSDAALSLLAIIDRLGPPLREELILARALARAVFSSGDKKLIEAYSGVLTTIPIPAPKVRELSTETWAEVVNPLHLDRLTKFMDVLEIGGNEKLLVHVIASLYIAGVFIPDDRLFQRRISSYLNSPAVKSHLLLNYLLLQKLPVYFNEIGAGSKIRDYSTEIDSWGNDAALYFVRKQVHVNASNYNVRLVEKVIESWAFNNPSILKPLVPADVYASLDPGLIDRYSKAIRPFFESIGVIDADGLHIDYLLLVPEQELEPGHGGSEEVFDKIRLICLLYRELMKKYSLAAKKTEKDDAITLNEELSNLKNLLKTILSTEKTPPRESLYFKRHIAFGIPSVLGTYHEAKFDAFAGLLRADAAIRVSLEKIISLIERRWRNAAKEEIASWLHDLPAASELLTLHGLPNRRIQEIAQIGETSPLYFSQLADLLRIWQKEILWAVNFFTRTFQKPVVAVVRNIPHEDLPDYLGHLDRTAPGFVDKAADIIIRDILATVPGLMETDRLVEKLLTALRDRIEAGRDERINEGVPEEAQPYFDLYDTPDETATRNAPLIGNKAKNLIYLHNRGFAVPAGAVLAVQTGAKRYGAGEFREILRNAVRCIEGRAGKIFGDAANPLFLSVRSGSFISMPGILETILYCGMNRETLQGFIRSTGDARLGWDSYRRFIEQYSKIVLNLDPIVFDQVRDGYLLEIGAGRIEELQAPGLQTLIERYEREIATRARAVPEDVYEQLDASVRAIFASWSNLRAEQFRRATNTSGHWGTSVTLMQMIPGNAAGSGASVFFTRNPFTFEQEIYGESRDEATGDELAYGRQTSRPLAGNQTVAGKTGTAVKSLEEIDPELFGLHRSLARDIEQAMGGLPQEVETTFVRQPDGKKKIFLLQTRRMEFSAARAAGFDEICAMESRIIARGTGAHGGALSGAASFARSPDDAARLRKESGMPVILLRTTANTDDVSLMPIIRGIITSAGGITSHAAVLAQKFDINAVVGCAGMSIHTNEQGEPYARLDGTIITEGSLISIDGSTGLVFSGSCLTIPASGHSPDK